MMKNKMPYCHVLGGAVVFTLLATNLATPAQELEQPKSGFRSFLEQDYLFGDWGGLRTELSKHGVDFEFLYGASLPDNLDGGVRRGAVYQGALLMMLDLDSEKL